MRIRRNPELVVVENPEKRDTQVSKKKKYKKPVLEKIKKKKKIRVGSPRVSSRYVYKLLGSKPMSYKQFLKKRIPKPVRPKYSIAAIRREWKSLPLGVKSGNRYRRISFTPKEKYSPPTGWTYTRSGDNPGRRRRRRRSRRKSFRTDGFR